MDRIFRIARRVAAISGPNTCKNCRGTGFVNMGDCPVCDGTGKSIRFHLDQFKFIESESEEKFVVFQTSGTSKSGKPFSGKIWINTFNLSDRPSMEWGGTHFGDGIYDDLYDEVYEHLFDAADENTKNIVEPEYEKAKLWAERIKPAPTSTPSSAVPTTGKFHLDRFRFMESKSEKPKPNSDAVVVFKISGTSKSGKPFDGEISIEMEPIPGGGVLWTGDVLWTGTDFDNESYELFDPMFGDNHDVYDNPEMKKAEKWVEDNS